MIQSILVWLGFVRLHEPGKDERLILVTDELRRVTRADVADRQQRGPTPVVVVADDLTIHLTNPEPIHVWSVLAFADALSLGRESVFAITPDSLRTAQAAGFLPTHVEQFFRRQMGATAAAGSRGPPPVVAGAGRGIRAVQRARDRCADGRQGADRPQLLENDGYVVGQFGPAALRQHRDATIRRRLMSSGSMRGYCDGVGIGYEPYSGLIGRPLASARLNRRHYLLHDPQALFERGDFLLGELGRASLEALGELVLGLVANVFAGCGQLDVDPAAIEQLATRRT